MPTFDAMTVAAILAEERAGGNVDVARAFLAARYDIPLSTADKILVETGCKHVGNLAKDSPVQINVRNAGHSCEVIVAHGGHGGLTAYFRFSVMRIDAQGLIAQAVAASTVGEGELAVAQQIVECVNAYVGSESGGSDGTFMLIVGYRKARDQALKNNKELGEAFMKALALAEVLLVLQNFAFRYCSTVAEADAYEHIIRSTAAKRVSVRVPVAAQQPPYLDGGSEVLLVEDSQDKE